MKERKGLVIKVYDDKVLVLSEGEFVYVKIDGKKCKKGQEITFYTKTETKTVVNWSRVISYASVPAIVSLFLLITPPSAADVDVPTGKENVAIVKPVVPKHNIPTKTEPSPEKKVVKADQPKKEEKAEKEENKQTIPKSKRKRERKQNRLIPNKNLRMVGNLYRRRQTKKKMCQLRHRYMKRHRQRNHDLNPTIMTVTAPCLP